MTFIAENRRKNGCTTPTLKVFMLRKYLLSCSRRSINSPVTASGAFSNNRQTTVYPVHSRPASMRNALTNHKRFPPCQACPLNDPVQRKLRMQQQRTKCIEKKKNTNAAVPRPSLPSQRLGNPASGLTDTHLHTADPAAMHPARAPPQSSRRDFLSWPSGGLSLSPPASIASLLSAGEQRARSRDPRVWLPDSWCSAPSAPPRGRRCCCWLQLAQCGCVDSTHSAHAIVISARSGGQSATLLGRARKLLPGAQNT